jgi:hypothetical protein
MFCGPSVANDRGRWDLGFGVDGIYVETTVPAREPAKLPPRPGRPNPRIRFPPPVRPYDRRGRPYGCTSSPDGFDVRSRSTRVRQALPPVHGTLGAPPSAGKFPRSPKGPATPAVSPVRPNRNPSEDGLSSRLVFRPGEEGVVVVI